LAAAPRLAVAANRGAQGDGFGFVWHRRIKALVAAAGNSHEPFGLSVDSMMPTNEHPYHDLFRVDPLRALQGGPLYPCALVTARGLFDNPHIEARNPHLHQSPQAIHKLFFRGRPIQHFRPLEPQTVLGHQCLRHIARSCRSTGFLIMLNVAKPFTSSSPIAIASRPTFNPSAHATTAWPA
jgi:hypothetical protein